MNHKRILNDHTWTERSAFIRQMRQLLGCDQVTALKAYDVALYRGAIVEIAGGVQGRGPASMESFIAKRVNEMLAGQFDDAQIKPAAQPDEKSFISFFKDYYQNHHLKLNPQQKDAVVLTLTKPFGLITGGAGVGKTTVLHAVIEASRQLKQEIHMMAFTGRAARRMEETSGYPATTIHSFCNQVDEGQIDLDTEPIIIIDESSMVDLATMYRIFLRLTPGCRLIMIGDPGQLPPIGFGIVFHAFCEFSQIPQIELTEIHRQAATSGIPQASKDIRKGIVPELLNFNGKGPGVFFIDCPMEKVSGLLMGLVDNLGGFDQVQILSPLKRGKSGSQTINKLAHEIHASDSANIDGFAVNEPVIWLQNDYELGLMNGSLGKVASVDGNLEVQWDPEGLKEIDDTDDMDYAYCITVHKSQGSEFSRVLVPIFESRLLDRTLIYTAITRSKEQVVLVGNRSAFEKSVVAPGNANLRQTALKVHLMTSKQH